MLNYLAANPGKTLVILAGPAHVGYLDAIPRRIWRRYPVPQAWVFPDPSPGHYPGYGLRGRHPLPPGHPPTRS